MNQAQLLWNQARVQAAKEGRLPSDVLRDVQQYAQDQAIADLVQEAERRLEHNEQEIRQHIKNLRFDLDRIEGALGEGYSASGFTSSSVTDLQRALALRDERRDQVTALRWAAQACERDEG